MVARKTYSGKVRDIYDSGDDRLLMVASDRLSAFDVILDRPIPNKGRVLTGVTCYWFDQLRGIVPNHLITANPAEFDSDDLPEDASLDEVSGRAMLVKRAEMIPVECIVRGYLAGSGWKEYQATQTLHGEELPAGLRQSERLPEPRFTPSTKAAAGHDENISFAQLSDQIGSDLAAQLRDVSIAIFQAGSKRAEEAGLILADTKFEFGWINGKLSLCDEVMTPDSSRYWSIEDYQVGTSPASFDKQPVRDWLESTGWDKVPPAPPLTEEVIGETQRRYERAYELLVGKSIDTWYGS